MEEIKVKKVKAKDIDRKELGEVYLKTQSIREVAKHFGLSKETIRSLLHKEGICNEPILYKCNENFFADDNEASFYVAGFIAADGAIVQKKNTLIVSISLSQKDKSHLQKIKDLMQAENPILDYLVKMKDKNPNWNDCWKSELKICSNKMSEDLKRFNIVQRKTKIYTFPDWLINHPLAHHFIRGYFDGDGSVFLNVKEDRITPQLYVTIRGTQSFLSTYREILERECDLEEKLKEIRISNGIGILEYGGNILANKIMDYLYKDATVYLQRKFTLVDNHNKNVSQLRELNSINAATKAQEDFRKASYKWLTKGHEEFTPTNIIRLYKEEESYAKVAKLVNKRGETVKNVLLEAGVSLHNNSLNLEKQELENAYAKHGTIAGVAKELGHAQDVIKKYMAQHNLDWNKTTGWEQNHSYFSIENESPEQYYWAGYLLGNCTIDNHTFIVSSADLDKLERFRAAGITGSPITTSKAMHRLSFTSEQIEIDLKDKFNITPEKKLKYLMPQCLIDHSYFHHFLRGRIEVRATLKEDLKQLELTGPVEYLEQIRDVLVAKCGLNCYPSIGTRTGTQNNRMSFTGKAAQEIVKYLENKNET